jgi:signal transduction histidine kinase
MGLGNLAFRVAVFALTICVLLTFATVFGIDLTARMYHQEANQRLNRDLADWLVHQYHFERNGQINTAGSAMAFSDAMRLNPSIEAYLVDPSGQILAYNAPDGSVKLDRVAIDPIKRFVNGSKTFPILGTDPRNPDMWQVFSAAPIRAGQNLIGYAYVVVGGEQYQDLLSRLRFTRILPVATIAACAVIVIGAGSGLAGFWFFTRRIIGLGADIDAFTRSGFSHIPPAEMKRRIRVSADELDQLRRRFHGLARVVQDQVAKLQTADQQLRDAVTSLSHDLRTPLTALGGYLETLSMGGDQLSAEERNEYLDLAIAQQQRLARLVRAQFDLALLESGTFPVDRQLASLSDLVSDVGAMFMATAQAAQVVLNIDGPSSGIFANVDVALMQRLLDNLLSNAIRHTPAGGNVLVSMVEEASQVIMSVRDTGTGISGPDLDRVFSPYFRSGRRATLGNDGTGLGLAIAKRIVELHGGKIRVMSAIGQGSVFECTLPK